MAIETSGIQAQLNCINASGGILYIYFKTPLSSSDKNILDGNTTNPAGGVIASTCNTPPSPQLVATTPDTTASRIWCYSHDFCNKTSWFGQAVRVANEAVGTGDGTTTTFQLANPYVIDVTHGLTTDENNLVPTPAQGGTTYVPQISVGGTLQVEQEYGFTSAPGIVGNYTINHATGQITFLVPPPSGQAITAAYFYSPNTAGSSQFTISPPPGVNYYITDVFVQCSSNVTLSTTLCNAIFVPNPYTGQLMIYPGSQTTWKKITDLMNYSDEMCPVIPSFGGSPRGLQNPALMFHVEYQSPVELIGNDMMQIRAWTGYDIPLPGEFAVASYFGLSY
jgi:hypothetical protein